MRRLSAYAIVIAAVLAPAAAGAQTTVTVLGLRSAADDEEVARQMTSALRQAAESATSESGFQHTGRENDLGQLMIAFACDEASPSCLRQIGESIQSDRVVYGTVERRSGRGAGEYVVTLRFFDVGAGRVVRSLQEVVSGASSVEALLGPASRFYASLTGAVVRGELAVRASVAGAIVTVDGQEVGTTSEEPVVLRDVEPGEVLVAVRHADYAPYEQRVRIEPGRLAEVEAELEPAGTGAGPAVTPGPGPDDGPPDGGEPIPTTPRPRRSLAWLGWTSLGLGVVFAGLGIWSSMEVYNSTTGSSGTLRAELNCWVDPDEDDVQPWGEADLEACPGVPVGQVEEGERDVFGRIFDDNADPRSGIERDELESEYNRAQLFQTLQFVFYGLGAVAGAVGIYFLVREYTADRGESDDELGWLPRLSLTPAVLQGGGGLSASLRF